MRSKLKFDVKPIGLKGLLFFYYNFKSKSRVSLASIFGSLEPLDLKFYIHFLEKKLRGEITFKFLLHDLEYLYK